MIIDTLVLIIFAIDRFEKKVNFRKFKGYVTDVEIISRAHSATIPQPP
jgi:hypothetical protein